MPRPGMKRAWLLVGLLATAAAATAACTALVPDLPAQPDAGVQDGGGDAPGADASTEVSGSDASVGTSDTSDAAPPDAFAPDGSPTCVQNHSKASGNVAVTTLSAPFEDAQTAGDLIIAIVFVEPGNVSQPPTDSMGNQYHLAKHQADTGTKSVDVYLWYAWNIAAAKPYDNTVTIMTTNGAYTDLILEEWTNVQSTADPLDTTGGASAQPSAPRCSLSPTAPGVVIAGSASYIGQTGAASGSTLRVQTTDNDVAVDRLVFAPGPVTVGSTPIDSDWTIAAAVFKAAP
nr:hypothetical protein Hi04_10k_c2441B_00024 [uncultured bacterium]